MDGLADKRPMNAGQIEVLRVLAQARGPITRTSISERYKSGKGCYLGYVCRLLGFEDARKRLAYESQKHGWGTPEQPFPSLLTRGYVRPVELSCDGAAPETGWIITPEGRKALASIEE